MGPRYFLVQFTDGNKDLEMRQTRDSPTWYGSLSNEKKIHTFLSQIYESAL